MMLDTLTDPDFKESVRDDLPFSSTGSLSPGSEYYLVRSNLPGLCFEIENPATELPVLSFDFKVD